MGTTKNGTIDDNQRTPDEYYGGNFGADIFGALAGERGTYLTVNQR